MRLSRHCARDSRHSLPQGVHTAAPRRPRRISHHSLQQPCRRPPGSGADIWRAYTSPSNGAVAEPHAEQARPAPGVATPQPDLTFDAAHPVPPPGAADTHALLQLWAAAAAAADAQPSAAWVAQLSVATQPTLVQLSAANAAQLLQHAADLGHPPEGAWLEGLLSALQPHLAQLPATQLVATLWAMSNLTAAPTPPPGFLPAALAAAQTHLGSLMAPDLARLAAAVGALLEEPGAAPPPPEWTAALLGEAEYQLVEYPGDWTPFDLARFAAGIAGVLRCERADADDGASAPPEVSERLMAALMKVVYAATRTIEEKAAVDFALAALAPEGARSMHFDARWTHEELKWLPRRERDKRRILSEGWVKTQWGGWRGGRGG